MLPKYAVHIQILGWFLVICLASCGVSEQSNVQTSPQATTTPNAETLRQTVRSVSLRSEQATIDTWASAYPTQYAIFKATQTILPATSTPGSVRLRFGTQSIDGNGFLLDMDDDRFWNNRYNRYKTLWGYDIGEYTLELVAGARVFDEGPNGIYRLPEPYQGILLPGRAWSDEYENAHFGEQPEVELPVRDGAAQIVDARVHGEQILLTVKTTGGSVYVYDFFQRSLTAPQPPVVDAGGPYLVTPGASITLSARGQDAAGVLLEYAWDLDGNGSFERTGQEVTFSAPNQPQATDQPVAVRVTSKSGLSATAQALVQVRADAPTTTP